MKKEMPKQKVKQTVKQTTKQKAKEEDKEKDRKWTLTICLLLIIISFIFLIGTTFAWFTDSATSEKNKIVAGNLDVEIQYVDLATAKAAKEAGKDIPEDAWKNVTADDNLFKSSDDILWEPGHTEIALLRVKNVGSLALKYNFKISSFGTVDGGEEKAYVNAAGNKFKLSEHLVLNLTDGVDLKNTRNEYWIQNKDDEDARLGKLESSETGVVLAPGETKELTLAVYMPTTVGNEANQAASDREANGAPELYFGVTVNATQAESETDAFGNDYDKNVG